VEWLSLDDWNKERTELNRQMESWRSDWESRDVEKFLAHYSDNFKSGAQGLADFAQQKRQVNAGKEWIKVKLSDVSMFRAPDKEDYVVVTFEQTYRSNNLNNQMKKRQYWVREKGTWKIIYEGAA
jgi:histidinol-phosphate/aromatic aminotransferase/cobyric acid decarboxylase-like protein